MQGNYEKLHINFCNVQNIIMSGISRRIDQLGRIVIPIEVRKKLKLEEGSLLDIMVENESLILSKSEPLKDFKKYIVDVCDSVEGCLFFVVTDTSLIFASSQYKHIEGKSINDEFYNRLKEKREDNGDFEIIEGVQLKDKYAYFYPLTTYGDNHGFACFFFNEVAKNEDKGMMCFVSKYITSKL